MIFTRSLTPSLPPRSMLLAGLAIAATAGSALALPPGNPARIAIPSPLAAINGPQAAEFALPLELDADGYRALSAVSAPRLTNFPLAPGQHIDLDLQRFEIFAPGASIINADGQRETPAPRPDVLLFRGTVAGAPESSVFLAISPHGTNGFIRLPGESWIIATPAASLAAGAPDAPTVIYELSSLPEGAITWAQFQCGSDALEADADPERLLQRAVMLHAKTAPTTTIPNAADGNPCRKVRIAIDTDWQYTTVFGGSTAAAQAFATTLIAAVSEIYTSEINTSFEVTYLRTWETNNTPWTSTDVNGRLTEFRSHWNGNMSSVPRNIAHLLSGLRSGAGGVAYLGVLCGGSNAYGVSGYMNGSFPYPLVSNNWQNWDVMVVAHEIGHNFNAPHTHSMSPPIDGCGNSDCSLASQGTIMSYCHTCSGGMSNISLNLHARIINERILPYMNTASCAASLLCPTDPGACCLPWGGCEFIQEAACDSIPGATFAGEGIACAAASCAPAGACCLADGSCVQVSASQCASVFSGTFRGDGIDCGEGRCAVAPQLWNHGPLLTNATGGCSGRSISAVQTSLGNSTRGFAWTSGTNTRIADEFIIPAGEQWIIDSAIFYGYDVNASSPNFSTVRVQIWDGDPRDPSSSVVAGNLTTNRLANSSMLDMHRTFQTDLGSCQRRIQNLNCTLGFTLDAGTYWIDRAATGPSTPWMAPVTFAGITGKPAARGLQFISGAWSETRDAGTGTPQDLPFVLLGTRVGGCYANCDGSTTAPVLNVDDFTCFINQFAGAQQLPAQQQVSHYANCDGSTAAPVLNVDDFTCFINEYASGCP